MSISSRQTMIPSCILISLRKICNPWHRSTSAIFSSLFAFFDTPFHSTDRSPLYWGMGWITTPRDICGHKTSRWHIKFNPFYIELRARLCIEKREEKRENHLVKLEQ